MKHMRDNNVKIHKDKKTHRDKSVSFMLRILMEIFYKFYGILLVMYPDISNTSQSLVINTYYGYTCSEKDKMMTNKKIETTLAHHL